ncbi:MAG: FixH family protein [Candidatus Rokubacteria bacterium]|nr:FixH family protein [Candidatus Rokubacteria bacterium]
MAGARVELLADMRTMPGVHKVPPVLLSPGGEPGTYRGAVRLPMAGPWQFRIRVSGPVTGVVDFVDQVGEASTALFSASSGTALRLRDSLDLAGRGLHFLGAAVWLGGLAMLAVLSVGESASSRLRASPRPVVLWHTAGLALLLLTGVYNLLYSTPTGRLLTLGDLRDILAQPYGVPYAGLLLYKLGAFVVLAGLGLWALGRWRELPALTWLRLNLALGLLILVLGGALGALHIFIHSRPGF